MAPSPPSLPSPSAVPAVIPQEPDVSIKYHVLLGLPNDHVGGFDAPAYKTADVDDSHIAAFRRHLKACSILPKSVAPSDAIKIMLRINMTPDGRLASEPILVEASASAKDSSRGFFAATQCQSVNGGRVTFKIVGEAKAAWLNGVPMADQKAKAKAQ